MKKKILITGSQGFIGSYLCAELLANNYEVVGIDNFSKYGRISRPHDKHPNFTLVEGDAKKLGFHLEDYAYKNDLNSSDFKSFDYIIALAAKIGGISYFHEFAYDLFTENEKILASTCDFARDHNEIKPLERLVVISSSMVYESTQTFPTFEEDIQMIPMPISSYGRQKLTSEWWVEALEAQYRIPYTIIRPFNCVGIGEEDSIEEHEITSGNVKLLMSHVLPDLINKCLKGQDPLRILGKGNQVRAFTNGKDIARGIRIAMESEQGINNDFNISTSVGTSVLELAQKVWKRINPDKPFRCEHDPAYEHDVQFRLPDISKAREVLGFEAKITLDESINEVLEYMRGRK